MLMGTPTAPVTLHNGAGFGGNIFLPWPTEACTLGTWSIGVVLYSLDWETVPVVDLQRRPQL